MARGGFTVVKFLLAGRVRPAVCNGLPATSRTSLFLTAAAVTAKAALTSPETIVYVAVAEVAAVVIAAKITLDDRPTGISNVLADVTSSVKWTVRLMGSPIPWASSAVEEDTLSMAGYVPSTLTLYCPTTKETCGVKPVVGSIAFGLELMLSVKVPPPTGSNATLVISNLVADSFTPTLYVEVNVLIPDWGLENSTVPAVGVVFIVAIILPADRLIGLSKLSCIIIEFPIIIVGVSAVV
jgi:hypothetical protein